MTAPAGTPPPKFADAARAALADTQLRRNLHNATATIRERRAAAAGELPDWEELRAAGAAIKDRTLLNLDRYLEELERAVTDAGGTVHWAATAAEANRIVTRLVRATGQREVVKVKSMVTQEIGLNEALAAAGITARETDLAELIVQLGDDRPSHILVPAIHRNRAQIRELFLRAMPGAPADLTDEPAALAAAARAYLRERFLAAEVAVSGANFMVAETGTMVVLESEGNGRMCLTLPETLITVAGIEKVVPTWEDLEVFLQLLPRSSTGERMNPYTSTWTGVTPGDGPREFHLVLLDNGRTKALADEVGRAALRCIRCSACLNVCPVYERTGGHAYGSVYPGPIGAILTPQLRGVKAAQPASLPFASTLCGACTDLCPVKIDIPEILVHLRGEVVEARRHRPVPTPELALMRTAAWTMADPRRYEAALRRGTRWARLLSRGGRIRRLPGPLGKWSDARDLPAPPAQSFRAWWREREGGR
ncbi:LutB/LldF family L-lactate oxidation iron-sulfur protein [Actinomadura macrotermitis]|uniref:Lactate utilization protein B n=1 Tax=Actinomadura macrotermitis TaxID=2585200 RepID=A0A7K0C6C8_9ACTN|nr:Lactate utilization protein B [Actinomadura macrotermitis]